MESIKNKIRHFIKENFLLDAELKKLNDNDSFFKKGIIDSTGILELVSFIESAFGIKVKDEEMVPDNLDSVNKTADFIAGKKNK